MKKLLVLIAVATIAAACGSATVPAAQKAVEPNPNPTVRDLAWQPGLYVGRELTVTGVVTGTPGNLVSRHQEPGRDLLVTERVSWYLRGEDGDAILIAKEGQATYPEGTQVGRYPGLVKDTFESGTVVAVSGVWTSDSTGWFLLIK